MPNRIKKKICTKFWFMVVDFPQIPIARSGILKIPSGSTPCPRGFSKSPPGSGDLGENSLSKTRISSHIFFSWSKIAICREFVYVYHLENLCQEIP